MRTLLSVLLLVVMLALVACAPPPTAPTPMPTRQLSAPTLAPSPTFFIRDSDQLYGSNITDGQSNPTVAALPVDAGLPPLAAGTLAADGGEQVQVVLVDGTQLQGELYGGLARRPGVLLLAADADNWGALPTRLIEAGFTVLALAFPNPQIADMPALIAALAELGSVDPAHLAIIGADAAADVALAGCAQDAICDAVALLSPQAATSRDWLALLTPRPLFIAAAQDDAVSYPVALSLAGAGTLISAPAGRGTGLLINGDVQDALITFLQDALGG